MMQTSEQINEIAGAMAKAQGAIQKAVKDSKNPHFKSTYADLASVWDACRDALTSNGIAVIQGPGSTDEGAVTMTTRLIHSSGQWMETVIACRPQKPDAQGVGSTITYLRRFSLAAMAGVAPDDDDGEASVGRGANGNGPQIAPTNGASKPRKTPQREGNPFDDAPGDDVMVDYVASSGETRSIPLGKAINTLYSAHQAPQLSNEAYSGLLAKNADWLKRHDPKHYAILSQIDIRQPEAA